MMDGTTQCPHCDTRFKITWVQLDAYQGLVRCGHCLNVFDARADFLAQPINSELDLSSPVTSASSLFLTDEIVLQTPTVVADLSETEKNSESDNLDFRNFVPVIKPPDSEITDSIPVVAGEHTELELPRKEHKALWVALALLMLIIFATQIAYFFRVDIAARSPSLKPFVQSYCDLFQCVIALPQRNDLMSIESSSLEADPNNGKFITLNVLLRNHASYTLAFPRLELTLNDVQDKAVARREFKPSDYLPSKENEKIGLHANQELSLKLYLDTTDLNPNGYRLVLFYPARH